MLRYQENNELHRNFHGSTDNAMRFVEKTCGLDALKEVLRTTGRDVYKSIREKLSRGDASELIEHLFGGSEMLVWVLILDCAVLTWSCPKRVVNSADRFGTDKDVTRDFVLWIKVMAIAGRTDWFANLFRTSHNI